VLVSEAAFTAVKSAGDVSATCAAQVALTCTDARLAAGQVGRLRGASRPLAPTQGTRMDRRFTRVNRPCAVSVVAAQLTRGALEHWSEWAEYERRNRRAVEAYAAVRRREQIALDWQRAAARNAAIARSWTV
jgi:hypothetical protein